MQTTIEITFFLINYTIRVVRDVSVNEVESRIVLSKREVELNIQKGNT